MLTDLLLDAELRGRMERLGLQRAASFTWQKSACATLAVYKEIVGAQGKSLSTVGTAMAAQRKQ